MGALNQEEMTESAQSSVGFALKKGAEEAEAFAYQGITTTVGIENAQIAKSSKFVDQGIGIRTVIGKAVGFAYTNILNNDSAIEQTVLMAISSAKASKPDKDWHNLPTKRIFGSTEKTYDTRIVHLKSEDLVEIASEMLDAAQKSDKRVFPIEGGVGTSLLSFAIANSNDVVGFDRGTLVECSLATVGQENGQVTPVCFEFNAERSFDIDPEWVGKEAAKLATSALKTKPIETKNMKVIFTQFALQELATYTLINAVKADLVQTNQSALKGKINEKVASELVTIHDDGALAGGLRSWKFDGEGVRQQRTPVIENGVLCNYLYDNYSAKKENRESTGNAGRAGYLSTPRVEATNFHLAAGEKSPEELIGETDEGLIVSFLQGAHSSNPASGDFSVVATPAWKVEHGKIAHATKGVMIAGNIFDVLTNVSELANNERKLWQMVAPWIVVENVKVIGK